MVRYCTPLKLTARQLRFLRLMYPTGSVAVGLDVGEHMRARGYLTIGRDQRYMLSPEGIKVIEGINRRRGALPKPVVLPASSNEAIS